MTQKQANIRKFSGVANVLFKILRISFYVGIGILLSGLIFVAVGVNEHTLTIIGQNVSLVSPLGSIPLESFVSGKGSVIAMIIEVIFMLALLSVAFLFAERVFKSTYKTLTPFDAENGKNLKRVALFMGLSGVVPAIIAASVAAVMKAAYESNSNGMMVVFAVVVFWLAMVFDYGASLQQESDETL